MAEETCMGAIRETNAYLADVERRLPFFVALDDGDDYAHFVSRFAHDKLLPCFRLHDFCRDSDSFPDMDWMIDTVRRERSAAALLLGVGDAVRLFDPNLIGRMRDVILPCKLVVPCRGAREKLRTLAAADAKFGVRQVAFARTGASHPVEVYPKELAVDAVHGVKNLLKALEGGGSEPIKVLTKLKLHGVAVVRNAYEAWRGSHLTEPFTEEMLNGEQWKELLADDRLDGHPIDSWRTFLLHKKAMQDGETYIGYVAARTASATEWRNGLVRSILDIPRSDQRFARFFAERRRILGELNWKDADGAEFAAYAEAIPDEDRYAYFTDRTIEERKALIACLSGMDGIPKDLKRNDERLSDYLQDFHFPIHDGEFWTAYFREYKRCKVLNRIEGDFIGKVESEAKERCHWLSLPTRGSVMDRYKDGQTGLFWLDALGSEYLGYIQSRIKDMGLSMKVSIVRANLPTLTCYNSDFYVDWPSSVKCQSKELDEIKHEGAGGFDFRDNEKPIHLAAELDKIDKALEWIEIKLKGRKARRILLASDHGASRLAVIRKNENKWTMGTRGEHSGRCCPKDEIGGIPECATEEETPDGKTFWVLANYDRFQGGRKASVEVHGGASLEEVAIPLIEFTLGKKVSIENRTPSIQLSAEGVPTLRLFSPDALADVSVAVDGVRYKAKHQDAHKMISVPMQGMKRTGELKARVFEGDTEIGSFKFNVEGRAARIRKDTLF